MFDNRIELGGGRRSPFFIDVVLLDKGLPSFRFKNTIVVRADSLKIATSLLLCPEHEILEVIISIRFLLHWKSKDTMSIVIQDSEEVMALAKTRCSQGSDQIDMNQVEYLS